MKHKNFTQALRLLEKVQDEITDTLNDLDQDARLWEEKDAYYNDVWMEVEEAIEAIVRAIHLNMKAYLS